MKVWLSWSSGKDSAWALHVLRSDPDVEVVGLLTTINQTADRVAMHAVRRELLEAQGQAAALPLFFVNLPWPCSNETYEERMAAACNRAIAAGVEAVAFGDLYLEDVRAYRERQMAQVGLCPLFPLWGRDTGSLANEMVNAGLRAVLTCVDPRRLDRSFAGRCFNRRLFEDLPTDVDPCGEGGEFHTFVHSGPMFDSSLAVEIGETVERDGFVFADVVLGDCVVGWHATGA